MEVKTAAQIRNDKLGATLVKALEGRFFEAYYCADKASALEKILSLIPEGSTIGWGGSMTMRELGVLDTLRSGNYQLLDRDSISDREERAAMERRCFSADFFLSGANAISEDGQIVNIDGNGNRVAAVIYGPKNVIIAVGLNKVAKDLDAAMKRARNTAAPINMARFAPLQAPCKLTGACADCKSPDSICNYFTTIRLCKPQKRIKVVLVGEDLGF